MRKHEWSYLAGLLDGEGTFTISTLHPTGYPAYNFRDIYIANTNIDVMNWLKERLDGSIRVSRESPDRNTKTLYKWHPSAKQHEYIIRNTFPFLVIKKKHAQLLMEFIELKKKQNAWGRGRNGLTEQERAERNTILEKVSILNQRGLKTALND